MINGALYCLLSLLIFLPEHRKWRRRDESERPKKGNLLGFP